MAVTKEQIAEITGVKLTGVTTRSDADIPRATTKGNVTSQQIRQIINTAPQPKPIETPQVEQPSIIQKIGTGIKSFFLGEKPKQIDDEIIVNQAQILNEQLNQQIIQNQQQIDSFIDKGTLESGARERDLLNTQYTLEKAKQRTEEILGYESANKGFFSQLAQGIKDFKWTLPISANNYQEWLPKNQATAYQKLENNEELTSKDLAVLTAYRAEIFNNLVDKGLGTQAGDVITGTLTFGAEMYAVGMATGGNAIKPNLSPILKKIPSPKAQKVIGTIANNLIGKSVQAQFDIPTIEAKTAQYMLPSADYEKYFREAGQDDDILNYLNQGDDETTARYKAIATNTVEYASEAVGTIIDDATPFIKKAIVGKYLKNKNVNPKNINQVKNVLKGLSINNILGEVIEEETGEPIISLIEGEEYKNPFTTPEGRERLLVTVLGIAPLQGISTLSDVRISDFKRNKQQKDTPTIQIPVEDVDAVTEDYVKETKTPTAPREPIGVPQNKPQVPTVLDVTQKPAPSIAETPTQVAPTPVSTVQEVTAPQVTTPTPTTQVTTPKVTTPTKTDAEILVTTPKTDADYINTIDAEIRKQTEIYKSTTKGTQQASRLKGLGMQMSGLKRAITGNPTATEISNKLKKLNTLFKGREVTYQGKQYKVQSTAFGRTKIVDSAGNVETVTRKDLQLKEPTRQDAIASIKQDAKDEVNAIVDTNKKIEKYKKPEKKVAEKKETKPKKKIGEKKTTEVKQKPAPKKKLGEKKKVEPKKEVVRAEEPAKPKAKTKVRAEEKVAPKKVEKKPEDITDEDIDRYIETGEQRFREVQEADAELLQEARKYKSADEFINKYTLDSQLPLEARYIQKIPLNRIQGTDYIELDKALKTGRSIEKKELERIISPTDDFIKGKSVINAIELISNGDGTYSVMHGNHRLAQALLNGDKDILSYVEGESKGTSLTDIWNKAQQPTQIKYRTPNLPFLSDNDTNRDSVIEMNMYFESTNEVLKDRADDINTILTIDTLNIYDRKIIEAVSYSRELVRQIFRGVYTQKQAIERADRIINNYRKRVLEKYRVAEDVKAITGKDINKNQEQELIDLNKRFFGDDNVRLTLEIITNKQALGAYYDNIIEIVKGQANPKDTFLHEAVHKYIRTFSGKQEIRDLFRAGMVKYNTTDLSVVEERIAEDFIQYYKDKQPKNVKDKVLQIIQRVAERINIYTKNRDEIETLYDNIISGKAKEIKEKKAKPKKPTKKKAGISAFQQRVSEQLLSTDPSRHVLDERLGTYDRKSLEVSAKQASDYLEKNPKDALAVALGIKQAPENMEETAIAVATAYKAKQEGDLALWADIINHTSQRLTRLGREIVQVRGTFTDDSPENYIRKVIDKRTNTLGLVYLDRAKLKLQGGNVKDAVNDKITKDAKKLKERLTIEQTKIASAQSLIDSLRC